MLWDTARYDIEFARCEMQRCTNNHNLAFVDMVSMTNRWAFRVKLFWFLGAAIVVAVALFVYRAKPYRTAQDISNVNSADVESSGHAAIGSLAIGQKLKVGPGKRLIYRINFQTEVSPNGGTTTQSMAVGSATMALKVTSVNETGMRYGVQFSDVDVKLDGVEFGEGIENRMIDGVQRPLVVNTDNSGKVLSIAFSDTQKTEADGIVRGIIASLQFVRNREANEVLQEWGADEVDNIGRCFAKYRMTAPHHYVKSVDSYGQLHIENAFRLDGKRKIPTATLRSEYEVDDSYFVKRVSATQVVRLPVNEEGATAIRTTYQLSLVDIDEGGQVWAGIETWKSEALGQAIEAERNGRQYSLEELRARLAGGTLNTLTNDMKEAIRNADEDARQNVGSRMAALFELEPERAAEAAHALRNVTDAKEAQTVLGALAATKKHLAREAIEDVAKDLNCANDIRHHAITHLGLHDSPSEKTIDTLERCVQQESNQTTKSQAILSLGGVAGKVARIDPSSSSAERAVSSLVKGLNEASDPATKENYINALGNAGTGSVLGTLRTLLASQDAQVRATAVMALRHIAGTEVDGLLVAILLNDADGSVRRCAVNAITYRTPTSELLLGCATSLQRDGDESVRLEVVGYFSQIMIRSTVEATAALQLASKSDPSSEVRRVAMESIEGMRNEQALN